MGEVRQSMHAHQAACLLMLDLLLDQFRVKEIKSEVKAAQAFVDKYKNYGAGWFHMKTTTDFQFH